MTNGPRPCRYALEGEGWGQTKPTEITATEDLRTTNRRVERVKIP
jgi:outer membrane protein OmpA-like peptidoglycan-associated protein